ncbi:MAG: hypothetical protein AAGA68_25105 [Pseudomonadota bacterium]
MNEDKDPKQISYEELIQSLEEDATWEVRQSGIEARRIYLGKYFKLSSLDGRTIARGRKIISGGDAKGLDTRRVAIPPGHRALSLLETFLGKRNVERIFRDIICDMREEYLDALGRRKVWEARLSITRGYFSLASALGLWSAGKALRSLIGDWFTKRGD